jgi:hypothetical protein
MLRGKVTRKLGNSETRKKQKEKKRGKPPLQIVCPRQIPNCVVQSSLTLPFPLILEKPGVLQLMNVSILW